MDQRIFIIFAFCFLLFAFTLSAQPDWIQHYEPFQIPIMDYSYDSGNIKVLDDGCFVVNGTCAESDDIIGWYSEFGFLIKFDPNGNIIWAKKRFFRL
ncbi:MAG: hypothetical protein K9N09_00005 [Candidatus Cloacimonetes bacterium]|nr:hypothetical protein [Candidatus Cloacimonadota bacterium]MCF7812844.1 hypothetical protein [Candidatus Cloacimonadota bacterium]MCF7867056.1 hypothetical protein [Candidatus Cloacimonadota bacterium]MCF7882623.1 hypothetical protein [Candidatus Cloacimonadota bacterium]